MGQRRTQWGFQLPHLGKDVRDLLLVFAGEECRGGWKCSLKLDGERTVRRHREGGGLGESGDHRFTDGHKTDTCTNEIREVHFSKEGVGKIVGVGRRGT